MKRWIGALLVVAAFVNMIAPGLAQASSGPRGAREELVQLRGRYSRVFRTEKGLQYEFFAKPVHFQDEHGNWRQFSTQLSERGSGQAYAFTTTSLPYVASFTNKASRNEVEFRYRSGAITFGIPESPGTGATVSQRLGSTYIFRRSGGEIEFRYDVGQDSLKESIVLHSLPKENVFEFEVAVENAQLLPQPDGSISAVNPLGEPLWTILAPVAFDAAGHSAPSVTQAIVERDQKSYLVLNVDRDWLQAPDRQWPVIVDPTVTLRPDPGDGMDTYIEHWDCDVNATQNYAYPNAEFLMSGWSDCGGNGTDWLSLLKFPLNTLPKGGTVNSAKLRLYASQTTAHEVNVRPVMREWDEQSTTWDYPWTSPGAGTDLGPVVAEQEVRYVSWAEFDVTSLVREWVTGERPNHGIALFPPSGTTPTRPSVRFVSSDSKDSSQVPTLVVDVTPDSTPPEIAIMAPANGAEVQGPLQIRIETVTPGDVDRVDATIDGRTVGSWEGGRLPLQADGLTGLITMDNVGGLLPGAHTLRVRAFDSTGNVTIKETGFTLGLDTVEAPVSIAALGVGGGRVEVAWTPVTLPGHSYKLYRSTRQDFSDGVLVGDGLTGNSFVETPAQSGQLYFYRVTAVSPTGTESSPSGLGFALAGADPTVTVTFGNYGAERSNPHPTVSEASYYRGASPIPGRAEWQPVTAAATGLSTNDGDVFVSAQTGAGLMKGQLLSFNVLETINHQRIAVGLPQVEAADLRQMVTGATLSWSGFGKGANGAALANGAKLRLWNHVTNMYDMEASQPSPAGEGSSPTLVLPLSSPQTGEHIDGGGGISVLAEPTFAADTAIESAVSSDYAFLSVTFKQAAPTYVSAVPVGNGQVMVVWPSSALASYVHRGSSTTFTPDETNRVSPALGTNSFIDTVSNDLRPDSTYYYKISALTANDQPAISPPSGGVGPNIDESAVVSIAAPGNVTEYFCGDYAPGGRSTRLPLASITQTDGITATSECETSSKTYHAFKFDLFSIAQAQLGITDGFTERLSSITIDWTGSWKPGTSSGLAVWRQTYPTGWEALGSPSEATRQVVQIKSGFSNYLNAGAIWVAARSPWSSSDTSLSTDHIRVSFTVRPTVTVAPVDGGMNIAWTGAGQYHVYRSTTSESGYIQVTSTPVSRSYMDSTAEKGRVYYYAIRYVYPDGELGPATSPVGSSLPIQRVENGFTRVYGKWRTIEGSLHSGGSLSIADDATSLQRGDYTAVEHFFTGTGVAYVATKGCFGNARISVDGVEKGNFSLFADGSPKPQQIIYSMQGLDLGNHSIVVSSSGNSDAACPGINADAFYVYGPRTSLRVPSGLSAEYSNEGVTIRGITDAAGFRVYKSATSGNWYQPVNAVANLLTGNQSSGESSITGMAAEPANTTSLVQDSSVAWQGQSSIKVSSSNVGSQTISVSTQARTVPVAKGKAYSFSVYVKASTAGRRFWPSLTWIDAAGNRSQSAGTAAISTEGWQRIAVTAVAPANATSVFGAVYLEDAESGDSLWWDAAQLEQTFHVNDWVDGGTAVVPGGGSGYYVVTALGSEGEESSPSLSLQPTTAVTSSGGPVGLVARSGQKQVALSWTASPAAIGGYRVYRSLQSGGPFTFVASVPETVFTDTGADDRQTHYYRIRGIRADGTETPWSNEAFAVTIGSRLGLDARWPYVDLPLAGTPGYVQVQSGNLVYPVTDSLIPASRMAILLRRTYNSNAAAPPPGMPQGWRLNFQQQIDFTDGGALWTDGDGSLVSFALQNGVYSAEQGTFDRLVTGPSGGWIIERRDGTRHEFDSTGKIMRAISDRNGNRIEYGYDVAGRPVSISPRWVNPTMAVGGELSLGAEWRLIYDDSASGLLSTVVDGAGRVFHYGYDDRARLTSVTDSTGIAVARYVYNPEDQLSQVVDAEERKWHVTYSEGRVSNYGDSEGISESVSYGAGETTFTDALGRGVRFAYGADGRLTRLTDGLGGVSGLSYDSRGNVTGFRDPMGRLTALSNYDDWGNPGQIIDPLGQVTTIQYHDLFHVPTQRLSAKQLAVTEYDSRGNVIRLTVGSAEPSSPTYAQQVFEYEYDPLGLLRTAIDPRGKATGYRYDSRGWLEGVIAAPTEDPNASGTTTIGYDQAGNAVWQTDPIGRTTSFGYDLAGRRTRTTYPNGLEVVTIYDRAGYPVRVTDTLGTEGFHYDRAGKPSAIRDKRGGLTRFKYDVAGQRTAVIDARGNRIMTRYDALGRPINVTDQEGNTTITRYDAFGNTTQTTLPNGFTLTAAYDALNRLTRVISPPSTVEYRYDQAGNLMLGMDGNGNWTHYQYDDLNRLTTVYDAQSLNSFGDIVSQTATRYEYDASGNRTAVVDALGRRTSYVYDALNRVIEERLPSDIIVRQFKYDAAGQRESEANVTSGKVTLFQYDLAGHVQKVWHGGKADVVEFEYDIVGRKVGVRDQWGYTGYSYDPAGNLVAYADAFGNAAYYQYDANGNQTAMALREGTWYRTYDRANRLTSVRDPWGLRSWYTYSTDGRPLHVDLPYGASLGNFFERESNRLVKQVHTGAGSLSLSYGYDTKGNVIRRTRDSSLKTTYKYDVLDRLVKSTMPGKDWLYSYDAVGNRITSSYMVNGTLKSVDTYGYDAANRVSQVTRKSGSYTTPLPYSYDTDGRLIESAQTESISAILSPTSTTYEYDDFDRLTRTTTIDKDKGIQTIASFGYDGESRRVYQKVVTIPDVGTGTSESLYFQYDGDQVIAERDGAGTPIGIVTRGASNGLISLYRPKSGTLVYQTDRLGSVIQLVDKYGSTRNSYDYGDFGEVVSSTEAVRNDWKFTGAAYASAANLYHLGARYYHAPSGRFITQDTYKGSPWAPWTQNLYAYVGNNPINYIDPTGHNAIAATLGWVGSRGSSSLARLISTTSAFTWATPYVLAFDVLLEPTQTYAYPCETAGGPSCWDAAANGVVLANQAADGFSGDDGYEEDYWESTYGDAGGPNNNCGGGKVKGKQGDNTAKNKQAEEALKQAAKDQGVSLSKGLQRGFHDDITGQGLDGFEALYDVAVDFLQRATGCGGE